MLAGGRVKCLLVEGLSACWWNGGRVKCMLVKGLKRSLEHCHSRVAIQMHLCLFKRTLPARSCCELILSQYLVYHCC